MIIFFKKHFNTVYIVVFVHIGKAIKIDFKIIIFILAYILQVKR